VIAIVGCKSDSNGPKQPETPYVLQTLGLGAVPERYTGELWVRGTTAYTTSWGSRSSGSDLNRGNAVKIWDVSALVPTIVDSLIISDATTLGDVQVTDDGKYLVVATEPVPGSIVIYDLTNPRKPTLITRFNNADTNNGVHTAEVQPVNGRLYAFLSIDPRGTDKARLVILDITTPAAPTMVLSRVMGSPFVHDVFVRDGIMMTALWNDGLAVWDIGGGGKGGTVSNPVQLGIKTIVGGKAHNVYWFRQGTNRKYVVVGEEGPGSIGSTSIGDVHVLDASDFANMSEVAFLNVPGAGVHNFSADEGRGILYMAYYNAGVWAIDLLGSLGTCTADQKAPDGRCDLAKMNRVVGKALTQNAAPVYVWGVHFADSKLFASDMLNGLFRLSTVPQPLETLNF
jgi:hypothetical protein